MDPASMRWYKRQDMKNLVKKFQIKTKCAILWQGDLLGYDSSTQGMSTMGPAGLSAVLPGAVHAFGAAVYSGGRAPSPFAGASGSTFVNAPAAAAVAHFQVGACSWWWRGLPTYGGSSGCSGLHG